MTTATKWTMDEGKIAQLRMVVETYYDVQDVRIRTNNRIRQYAEFMALMEIIGSEEVVELRKQGVKTYKERLDQVKKDHPKEFPPAFENAVREMEGEEKNKKVNSLAEAQERLLRSRAQVLIREHPVWTEWLEGVRGIGPVLAGGLISWVNPAIARRPGGVWKYCGLAVRIVGYLCDAGIAEGYVGKGAAGGAEVKGCGRRFKPEEIPDIHERMEQGAAHEAPRCPECGQFLTQIGERDRMVAGKKAGFNPKARQIVWKAGQSFMKLKAEKSGYRALYEEMRRRVESRPCRKEHKDSNGKKIPCFDAHKLAKSLRLTVKVFMCHYWMVYRAIMGLPMVDIYATDMLGADPKDFIEPMKDDGEIDPGIRKAWAHFGQPN